LLDKVVLVVNTLGNTEVQSAVSAPSLYLFLVTLLRSI
jgi:hypothetical protein